MKIKILKNTTCGKKPVKKGATVDASEEDAYVLIQMKKAEAVKPKAEKPKDSE